MNDQLQHGTRQEGLRPDDDGVDAAHSAERLAEARSQLDPVYAAAQSILDNLRLGNSERFLEQVQQSGGE